MVNQSIDVNWKVIKKISAIAVCCMQSPNGICLCHNYRADTPTPISQECEVERKHWSRQKSQATDK